MTINLRFPGQYYDRETGFFYNWARYYNPETGRYISSDPIGLLGGVNTYGYVGGNPLTSTDRRGLCGFGDCVALGIGVGAGFVVGAASNVIGSYIAGRTPSLSDAIVAGLGGSAAVLTAGETEAATLALGTARAIGGIVGDIGVELGSRIRTGVAPREELLACLNHLLATAGNAGLMAKKLRHTLCDHAAGNYRIFIAMAAELLMSEAQREITVLDEKLYLHVFAPPETQSPRRVAGAR
ncbi:MAG: RHS repeat-associated core domain-containing protein [Gammaproteobacteria bacterium]